MQQPSGSPEGKASHLPLPFSPTLYTDPLHQRGREPPSTSSSTVFRMFLGYVEGVEVPAPVVFWGTPPLPSSRIYNKHFFSIEIGVPP
jgi:hypothetical protein